MFSIITRIEVTPFQTLGTCAEVRLRRKQSWDGREGPCLVSCACLAPEQAVSSIEYEGQQRHLRLGRRLCGWAAGHAGKRSVCTN